MRANSTPSIGRGGVDRRNREDELPAARREAEQLELERALGLAAALSIGMGTMIGAGIFLFPGLAGGRTGVSATVSFALGAVIALLVALPTSELATAMPRSGGGYFFVSRGLGTFPGVLAGFGQWLGLLFASAFYLVGFGHYTVDGLAALGLISELPATGIAFAAALALTGLNLIGTRRSGSLQNLFVGTLVFLLTAFLGYGMVVALGLEQASAGLASDFIPYGWLPVLTTTALVFTSYLGFAQIATVGGEIRQPARNLPLAMVGSVVLVGVLYVAAILLASSVFSARRLAELGETAFIEIARQVAGTTGAQAVIIAGMLATLSSANASILSSSRSVFALSRDRLIPRSASSVNVRFRTPHVALLIAGVPIAVLTLFGRVRVLAEVASLLHLVMYGLICFALIAFRRRNHPEYRPTFLCPAYPLVPILGGITSFGLVGFMGTESQIIGAGILGAVCLWYLISARRDRLEEDGPCG